MQSGFGKTGGRGPENIDSHSAAMHSRYAAVQVSFAQIMFSRAVLKP